MEQTHESKTPQLPSLADAEKIVGTGKDYDYILATQCFDIQYWVNIENDEKEKNADLVNAKNVVLRSLVEKQILESGRFDLSEIPLKNRCPDCRGTGEIYKLGRRVIEEGCKKCTPSGEVIDFLGDRFDPKTMKVSDKEEDKDKSSGKRIVECRNCEKGRYIKGSHEAGLKINVECRTCHGKAEVLIKCKTCRGKRFVKKQVLSGQVDSTTRCKTCHGKGFLSPKEKKASEPNNPLIPANLGEAIKDGDIPAELDGSLTQTQKQTQI
jgi:Zn finger protein HypA/HybF involved in hydrogenase expression